MQMKRVSILFLVFCLVMSACKKDKVSTTTPDVEISVATKEVLSFRFAAKNNAAQLLKDVDCHISDGQIIGWIPYLGSDRTLVPTFTIDGVDFTINGITQQSDTSVTDYTHPVTYTVKGADGTTKDYKVTLYAFTGLPVLYLETDAPVASKENYVKGKMTIDANSRFPQPVTEMDIEMRGRGNSTWTMPKKPYRIKLDKKAEMLGMPAAKKWVLLANFSDKTLMRNQIAFELGNRFEAAFTPRSRYVEVVLNGEYLGNYLLTDQVEVGETRVNIPELKASSKDITGGYLLEIDARLDETYWFGSPRGMPVTVKSPENITDAQFDYIKNYIADAENVLYGDGFEHPETGYRQYINEETFINWYLVNELLKNNDAIFFSSVFMFKDVNSKLSMGPIWDFDIAIGNMNENNNHDPQGWWIRESRWISRMFEDPAFEQKVKDRWNTLKGEQVNTIFTFINETATYLERSQKENFNKWGVLYNYTWPNPTVSGSYESEVQSMKQWLQKRINWMDSQLNG